MVLLWLNWQLAVQPLLLNREINVSGREAKAGACEQALKRAGGAMTQGTLLNYYANLKYVDVVSACIAKVPASTQELSLKAVQVLQKETLVRPTEPRTWLLLGGYTNNLAAFQQDQKTKEELLQRAQFAFEQAYSLSPRRPELFAEWARTELTRGEFASARQKTEQCLLFDRDFSACWFQRALTSARIGNIPLALRELAQFKKGLGRYEEQSEQRVLELAKTLAAATPRPVAELVELFKVLTIIRPDNAQYFASLAAAYLEAGNYGGAQTAALHVLFLQPENRPAIEQFFQILPEQFRPEGFR